MKIILLKDVRGVGQRHEVKDVANGYAINALFPQRAAEPATQEKMERLEAQRQAQQAEAEKAEEQLVKKIDSLRGKSITIAARATEKGGLFKAVASKDVAKAIRAQYSLEIPEDSIELKEPVKTLGAYSISLYDKTHKAELHMIVTAA